jgi:hypothetical protein
MPTAAAQDEPRAESTITDEEKGIEGVNVSPSAPQQEAEKSEDAVLVSLKTKPSVILRATRSTL